MPWWQKQLVKKDVAERMWGSIIDAIATFKVSFPWLSHSMTDVHCNHSYFCFLSFQQLKQQQELILFYSSDHLISIIWLGNILTNLEDNLTCFLKLNLWGWFGNYAIRQFQWARSFKYNMSSTTIKGILQSKANQKNAQEVVGCFEPRTSRMWKRKL